MIVIFFSSSFVDWDFDTVEFIEPDLPQAVTPAAKPMAQNPEFFKNVLLSIFLILQMFRDFQSQ
jgi:hypothetical protein